jgi:hypothetical protein
VVRTALSADIFTRSIRAASAPAVVMREGKSLGVGFGLAVSMAGGGKGSSGKGSAKLGGIAEEESADLSCPMPRL